MNLCAKCGNEVTIEGKTPRQGTCIRCGAYLHACVNCEFHSPGRSGDCREPQAEAVRDKRAANFCDFFRYRVSEGGTGKTGGPSTSDKGKPARDRFDKLFGG